MTREAILERLIALIQKQRSHLELTITEQTSLKDDLAVDSIELVEFVINIEDGFHIAIPDEDVDGMKSMGDMLDYLVNRLA
ncbi:phosphopantetheine-binding protein [Streptococcus dysgalactiae subsp. equisimilis]|uniref:Acyl carrier protein n=2 Tax=Streptococcus dysgalactiae TaxID=1334 RepID=A0AB38Y0U8_STREQ|nr:phosphopantetheine-binding protein [Streptococcus dysgalactiae]ADX23579.1 acyl carrier protein [Streptococcus dysgalactiae subsp. equisimilis ATCC 12394]EGL48721.1 putative acyl carrier protein [Streptococcus dysgalactiae subsp. equisimilis SK1249]BAN92467.1 acyl carrier protein [Streptococcus dysgalactiae subsp. equisimilis 167]KKC16632.1 acyl carrier protein [Streptococcus dysgalactiae subsp. equisimilis]KKC19119.1 acyl carrier protein [Streptococcus dysgalactiae subsp. equisimilis]